MTPWDHLLCHLYNFRFKPGPEITIRPLSVRSTAVVALVDTRRATRIRGPLAFIFGTRPLPPLNDTFRFHLKIKLFYSFRLERDLPARYDELGVKIRERIKWDVREAIVGSENFLPKHAMIATWKNISFVGGFNALETVRKLFNC